MDDARELKGGLVFLRSGAVMAALSATGLAVFGGSWIGSLELFAGPITRLPDDLAASMTSAALLGLGVGLVHRGLPMIAARRGITGRAKRLLILAALLTVLGAVVLAVGLANTRAGLFLKGRPVLPPPAQLERLARLGLAAARIGFVIVAIARGIVVAVAWTGRRLAPHPPILPRASIALKWLAYLLIAVFVLLASSSCQHGRAAAFVAAQRPVSPLATAREVYQNIDILLQHAIGAATALALLGFVEIAVTAFLPRARSA